MTGEWRPLTPAEVLEQMTTDDTAPGPEWCQHTGAVCACDQAADRMYGGGL